MLARQSTDYALNQLNGFYKLNALAVNVLITFFVGKHTYLILPPKVVPNSVNDFVKSFNVAWHRQTLPRLLRSIG